MIAPLPSLQRSMCGPEGPPGESPSAVVAKHTDAPGSVSSLVLALPRGRLWWRLLLGSDGHPANIVRGLRDG